MTTTPGPTSPFDYMRWAKTMGARARYPLCLSSVVPRQFHDLFPDGLPEVRLSLDGGAYGRDDLKAGIAARSGVAPEQVCVTPGASSANYFVLSSLLGPGDRLLLERPTYTVFDKIAAHRGAEVDWLERRADDAFAVDPEAVARAWRPETRVLALTSPNNPTGAALDRSTIDAVHEVVRARGGWLLLDEVYGDFVADRERYPSGADWVGRGATGETSRVIVTSSLTKPYGLGELRIGWVLGPPAIIRAALDYQDMVNAITPNPLQAWACALLPELGGLLERARREIAPGWDTLGAWAAARADVDLFVPPSGADCAFAFLRLHHVPDTMGFCVKLLDDTDTLINPGEHYGSPGWVRVGVALPDDLLAEGLARFGAALDQAKKA